MRHIGSEMLQLFKGFAKPREQSVQHARHVPKLVVWIVYGNPLIQPLSSNLLGSSRHFFKRVQGLARNTVAGKSRHNQCRRQGKEKQTNELEQAFRDWLSAIGEPDNKRLALEDVEMADREGPSPICEMHPFRLI